MEKEDTNEHIDLKGKPTVKHEHNDCKPSISDCKIEGNSLSNLNNSESNRSRSPFNQDSNCMAQRKVKENEVMVECATDITDGQLQAQQGSSSDTKLIPLTNSYPNYIYNAPNNFYIHANQQTYPVIYNAYKDMNTQWSYNQIEPVYTQPNDEMTAATSTSVAQSMGFDMTSNNSGGTYGFNPYIPMVNCAYNTGVTGSWSCYSMDGYNSKFLENEIINLPNCSLIPPAPYVKIRRSPKPPNCKTIFVGHLPENKTDDIMREIFSLFGEIETVRMSKKNFCHIRFCSVDVTEKALILSGYTLKIGNKDDRANRSRIRVDYALAKNDQDEWDCLQSAKMRELRQQFEAERTPSPPLVYYSENEACSLIERLKNEDTFVDSLHTLGNWLNRGECTKRTCGYFYSMMQSIHIQVKRLIYEKNKLDEKSDRARSEVQEKNGTVSMLLNEINKMFDLLQLPSIWNIFDKIQRKKLSEMRQKVVNIVRDHSKEMVEERVECEMDFSDDDCNLENPPSSSDSLSKITKEDVEKMKQERDSARKQLEAVLQVQAYVLEKNTKNHIARITRINEMKEKLKATEAELNELRRKRKEYLADHSQDIVEVPEEIKNESEGNQSSFPQITQEDMRFISLIAAFLNVHPCGANSQYICAYLQRIDPTITDRYVENLMKSHSNIFQEKDAASKTWICIAFH